MNQPTLEMLELAARRGDRGAAMALANRLVSEHPTGSPPHERGLGLLQQSAEAGSAQAQWMLGAYHLQVSTRGRSHEHAKSWLERAGAQGVPVALDRLADLKLSGLAGEESASDALALQLKLADQGWQRAAWEAAYLLDQVGTTGDLDAASAFLRAAALGSPPAYYSLGLRFANGTGVPRDVAFGRALLRRAADGGFAGAAEAAEAIAQESVGDQAWYDALKTNLHAVHPLVARLGNRHPGESGDAEPAVRQLEAHLVSLGHPSIRLDERGRARVVADRSGARAAAPQAWNWLSQSPRVAVCPRFASPEECAHLINKFAAAMRPASEYRRGNSANEDAELQSFSGRGFPASALDTDSVTRMLERRLSAMTEWPIERFEPCSFVCYGPGEEYKPHVDFFSDEQIAANERFRRDYGGQRIATFLLYLRAPLEGGETRYLDPGVNVVGETGMGVPHYNVTTDGAQDPASRHSGTPIVRGEKWLWRSTLRQRSLYER